MLVETWKNKLIIHLINFIFQAYATLLNCWKFLRASSYQVKKRKLWDGLYW